VKSSVSSVYFGKLPSRGDFVRSAQQAALTHSLDQWASGALELMATDARWKEVYDLAPPLHFAVLGVHNRVAMAGHLLGSRDASGRRFPFFAAGTFEVAEPLGFLARSPLALSRLWSQYERLARRAFAADDAVPVLGELTALQGEVVSTPGGYDAAYGDFLELQTVGSLQAALRAAHPEADVRLALLGLGQLLQPLPASAGAPLDKGLRLALPRDPLVAPYFATWWIDLVSAFLAHCDFEVVLFLPQGDGATAPALSIGFAGGSPGSLHAMLDRRLGEQVFVDLSAPAWAGEPAGQDYGLKKLAAYLRQDDLSLRQLASTFRETFLGA
jgi:type VI secretion system protein ImpM